MEFDKLFPDDRETGDTIIRQSQLVMLRMLKILDYICEKHNIKYFLTGGSLIGAVRHKGFIPWDDDLDVGMTRDNYDRFIQYGVRDLPIDIFFQNSQTDRYYLPNSNVEARIRDKYSSYNHLDIPNNKWHEGLQVDLFVYDRSFIPNNFFIATQNKLLNLLDNKKRVRILNWISKHSPLNLVYSSNYMQYYGAFGTYVTQKEYSNLIKTRFEDMEAYIPQGWDSYLRRQYGDYMQLPPLEKRVSNHKVIVDPFTPCEHTEVLQWQTRKINAN